MSGVASSKPGKLRDLVQSCQFVQHELHVGEGGVVGAHGNRQRRMNAIG